MDSAHGAITPATLDHPGRAGRIRTSLHWTLGPMLALSAVYALLGRPLSSAMLVASALALLPCYGLLKRQRTDMAADWLLVVASLAVGGLSYVGHGLRDISLLILPTVLVVAGLLRTQRAMAWLVALQLTVVLGVAFSYEGPASVVVASQPILALTLMPMLGMTAYAVWHLSQDLRNSLAQAQGSMQALEASHRRDALTGLPNRRAAEATLADAFDPADGRALAVAMLNLDGFRAINDAFGPQVGDRLLVALTERWRGMLTPDETLYRLSGDEFLLTRAGPIDDDDLLPWVQRFVLATREPVDLQGIEMRCTLSAGITRSTSAQRYAELLSQLDAAVRLARAHGRDGAARYTAALAEDRSRKLTLLLALRESLQRRQDFSLQYQPKMDLRTGTLVGAEALMRWEHPVHGPVSPAEFIPLAESSGLIVELGRWALQEACRQAQAWRQAGWANFSVAVNVSMAQCQRNDLVSDVQQALDNAGLPGTALVLELTESVLAHGAEPLHETLRRLHALGVTIAIDDFGTGYSNLAYLSSMEVQQLKIDQGFVRRLVHSAPDRAIVEAIVAMAHRLGLDVVAEGIEHADWAATLEAIGCHVGQGLHWAGPLPAEVFWHRFHAARASDLA